MDLFSKKCVPCEIGSKPLSKEEAEKYLEEVNTANVIASEAKQSKHEQILNQAAHIMSEPRSFHERVQDDKNKIASDSSNLRNDSIWELVDDDKGLKIRKRFTFNTYKEGIGFVNKIADVAESQDHHPDLYIGYKKVTVNLMTHNIGGLSENDFIMAAKIEKLPSSNV